MWEFVAKYWLEFLFGLVVAGLGIFAKKFWSMLKNEQNQQRKDFYDSVTEMLSDHKEEVNQTLKDWKTEVNELITKKEGAMLKKIDEQRKDSIAEHKVIGSDIKDLKDGLLGVYSKSFKEDCECFLSRESKEVSLDEYKELSDEHDVYNRLGGNHYGDELFAMAKKKVESEITK